MGNHLIIPGGTRTIDATGKFIIPGGIDMNVHLQRPGIQKPLKLSIFNSSINLFVGYGTQTIDDFYQGTKAALAGGRNVFFLLL